MPPRTGFGAAQQPAPGAPPPAQQPGAPAPGGAPAPAPGGQPAPNASPEEQALYNRFVGIALLHIYDEAVMPKLITQLKNLPNLIEGVGHVAAQVGMVVLQKSIDAGDRVSEEILLHGGREVVGAIAELAQVAGIGQLGPKEIDSAYYVAADEMRAMMGEAGLIDPAVVEQDMTSLKAMEESGDLAGLLRAMEGQV